MPKRVLQGVVVSDKADKTVVVHVERRIMHPLYKKFITRSKRFAAHDAENRCRIGDKVRIEECPPISKSKAYTVIYDENTGPAREFRPAGSGDDILARNLSPEAEIQEAVGEEAPASAPGGDSAAAGTAEAADTADTAKAAPKAAAKKAPAAKAPAKAAAKKAPATKAPAAKAPAAKAAAKKSAAKTAAKKAAPKTAAKKATKKAAKKAAKKAGKE